jgi:ribosomal protein S1
MKLVINHTVKVKNPRDKVYCHEPYAQQLYDMMFSGDKDFLFSKSILEDGTIEEITEKNIYVQSNPKETIVLNINKERKAVMEMGTLAKGMPIKFVKDSTGDGSGTLSQMSPEIVKQMLSEAARGKSHVFECIVNTRNSGGYFVSISGIQCYLPGGLAAANKIINFEKLINKKLNVMVDCWMPERNCYIVSNKKWITHVLPTKIKELQFGSMYHGEVTGCSKTGIFIEFDSVFTAFLNNHDMSAETLTRFEAYGYHPGDKIDFLVKEISTHNSRINLTQNLYDSESIIWKKLKRDLEGSYIKGEIVEKTKETLVVKVADEVYSEIPLRNIKDSYKVGNSYAFLVKSIIPDDKTIILFEVKKNTEDKK